MTAIPKDFRRPPGPSDAIHLGIDPETLDTLKQLHAEYGPIVSTKRANGRLVYCINDAHEVRQLLLRRHTKYHKGPGFERVKMLLGNGIIVSDGDVWRRSRTMIQPSFSRQKIHRLTDLMVECARTLYQRWTTVAESGGSINITEETSVFALDLILITIFGDDARQWIESNEENPFAFLSEDSTRDLSVVLKVRKLREMLSQLIVERQQRDTADDVDFMAMYMRATDKQGNPFSESELLDELVTLVVAGFETSANTLNWAWYLLATHSDIEARLMDEARAQVPDSTAVTAEAAAEMVYTQQVLEETLRLYPPVWLFSRRAHIDDELTDFDVPPGTDIYLSPYVLHRTDQYWPQPDRFDPSRFELGDKPKKDRPYFPFSLGPRRCVGEYFSFLEMKIHLGLLVPRFKMHLDDATDPGLELGINLRSSRDIMLRPEIRPN